MNKIQEKDPRYDLLTGETIKYKNKEQYCGSFYTNRKNLIKHFKQLDKNEVVKITKNILDNRIKNKNIKYAPCTVECKSWSIPSPSPALVNTLGLNFNSICEESGLVPKYRYDKLALPCNFKLTNYIIVDSREQEILPLKTKTCEIAKLDFGDYALSTNLINSLSIEKKNESDFVSSFSQGFERFCREMARAEKVNSNILIVVDNTLSNMLSFNYLPQFKRWVKATPQFIFSRLRELLQSFPNAQIVFVKNKEEVANITRFALSFGKDLFQYDIQYLYETKQLNDYI